MRIAKRVILFFVAILILLLIFKNGITEILLEVGIRHILGLGVDIGKTDVRFLRSTIELNNIRLFSPYGFKDRLMADIPKIYIDFDLGSLFRKPLHLNNIELELKEFVVVKNQHGKVNAKTIKPIKSKKAVKKAPSKSAKVNIDRLELSIGKVIYKDYTQGKEPLIQTFNINIGKEVYKDIADVDALVRTIIARALINTTVASLADMGVDTFRKWLSDATKVSKEFLRETVVKEGQEFLRKAEDLLKDTLEIPSE